MCLFLEEDGLDMVNQIWDQYFDYSVDQSTRFEPGKLSILHIFSKSSTVLEFDLSACSSTLEYSLQCSRNELSLKCRYFGCIYCHSSRKELHLF